MPQAQGVAGAHGGREVIGQLEFEVILHRLVLGAGAQDVDRGVGVVPVQHGARDDLARTGGGDALGEQARRIGLRLAMAVGVVDVEEPRPVPALVAQRGTALPGVEGAVGVVQLKGLRDVADLDVGFKLGRHAGDVIDHGADRVTGVGGGERAVHHIHPLDLFRRDQAPAWRIRGAVAQVVGQQNAVGVHRRTRAVAGARGAAGEHGVVVVANVALAHQQAGQVFERVFAVGGVDGLLDLLARDALDGGGNLRWQRGRRAAVDGDDAQRFDRGIHQRGGGGRSLRGCRENERQRNRKSQGERQGQTIFPHGKSPKISTKYGSSPDGTGVKRYQFNSSGERRRAARGQRRGGE